MHMIRKKKVAVAAGRLPFVGHALRLIRDPLPFLESLRDQGDIVKIYVGPKPAYILTNAELAREVMLGKFGSFSRDDVARAVRILFGDAVAALSGDAHRDRRRLLAPSFRRAKIAEHAGLMARVAVQHADAWRPGQRVEFHREAFEITLSTLTSAMFSTDLGAAAVEEIHRSLPWALKELPKRLMIPPFLLAFPTPTNLRFARTARRLRRHVADLVTAYRRDGVDHGDLLSSLIFFSDPETGASLTDAQIVDELVGFVVAGADTPAAMLCWVFHELGRHPDIERRVHAEIDSVIGSAGVRYEDVTALRYTGCVVLETLRAYSPWINLMQAATEISIAGVTLPAGSMVGFSQHMLHHDPRVFDDPLAFDPDRWRPERAERLPREASMPFSAGPRKCPGEFFALTELTIQIVTIAQRWRLRPAPDAPPVRREVKGPAIAPSALSVIVQPREPVGITPSVQEQRGITGGDHS
ncbi:MAG TPA: cytochrome P450 [Polyangia bacterium]|nr:cytochrome P450 [Polyangia bacterium]